MRSIRARQLVLVVDDEHAIRCAFEFLLRHAGFDVATSPSAERALDSLKTGRRAPAAIVTDFAMPPGPDGIALADAARRDGYRGPIVLVSGALPEDLRDRPGVDAVDRYLQKPIGIELVAVVEELLADAARAADRARRRVRVREKLVVAQSAALSARR